MLHRMLEYYIFEYEIKVYPNYTPLKDGMILNKMNHFWRLLKEDNSRYNRLLKKMISCFYDENGEDGKCISIVNSNSTKKIGSIKRLKYNRHHNDNYICGLSI